MVFVKESSCIFGPINTLLGAMFMVLDHHVSAAWLYDLGDFVHQFVEESSGPTEDGEIGLMWHPVDRNQHAEFQI